MKKVVITGAGGLVGWHVYCRLVAQNYTNIECVDREIFADRSRLVEVLTLSDVVIHCAGVNRDPEADIEAANPSIARQLLSAMDEAACAPLVIYANSTQSELDNPYGRSKREAARLIKAWTDERGCGFADVIIPNVFGERGRPFYNSVVSTFCHQLVNGQSPEIIVDRPVSLIHAQDLADSILSIIEQFETGQRRLNATQLTVSELLARLQAFDRTYASSAMPNVSDPMDLALFNTYRSYLYPERYPIALTSPADNRGRLFEAVRACGTGQVFVSNTNPGVTRGNHFHRRKIERFVVMQGTAIVAIRQVGGREIRRFEVSGQQPCAIDIPTLHTHSITNTGSGDLITLFWAHEFFDPERADTYLMPV